MAEDLCLHWCRYHYYILYLRISSHDHLRHTPARRDLVSTSEVKRGDTLDDFTRADIMFRRRDRSCYIDSPDYCSHTTAATHTA